MTITVLDRRNGSTDALFPASLGELHDRADTVPDELLPCRVNNSDLWFAESPADVEYAKTLARTARYGTSASPELWSGVSPGVSGAESCSSKEW
jgi:hypothetical protein